jgi:hypothetical protein
MTIQNRRQRCNAGELPLFAWAAMQRPRLRYETPAVRWLRRRYPLTAGRAALVADLAGLGARP